jgi:DNA-binding transcriptional ArsR family regulator
MTELVTWLAALEQLIEPRDWPDRLTIALEQSLFDGADRTSYCAEAGVSPATGSADLRRLQDAGLIRREGRGRNTRYTATPSLCGLVETSEHS